MSSHSVLDLAERLFSDLCSFIGSCRETLFRSRRKPVFLYWNLQKNYIQGLCSCIGSCSKTLFRSCRKISFRDLCFCVISGRRLYLGTYLSAFYLAARLYAGPLFLSWNIQKGFIQEPLFLHWILQINYNHGLCFCTISCRKISFRNLNVWM